jgi:hypothetical protein
VIEYPILIAVYEGDHCLTDGRLYHPPFIDIFDGFAKRRHPHGQIRRIRSETVHHIRVRGDENGYRSGFQSNASPVAHYSFPTQQMSSYV